MVGVTKMKINKNVNAMNLSPVRKVLDLARKLESNGQQVVHFEIGEPDFNTPNAIKETTIKAIQDNHTHYGPNRGVPQLRGAISTILKERSLKYNPDEEIIVTLGAAEALVISLGAYINDGDEVIVFTPAFMNYKNLINFYGGVYVPIPLKEENGFQLDSKLIEDKITKRTKIIIINNPHNPTGTVFTESSIRELARIAKEHNLLVISDEIYDEITYMDKQCIAIGSIGDMKNRTITINGFSKSHAMTGWRIGYLATDKSLILPILKIHQYVNTCAPTFIQIGLAKGLLEPSCRQEVKAMVSTFEARRSLILGMLSKIPKISFSRPDGAFYLFINVSKTGLSGDVFAARLLEEKGVAVVPGSGFSETFSEYIRISYATNDSDIKLGISLFAEFVRELT
jgi:aminotransferase